MSRILKNQMFTIHFLGAKREFIIRSADYAAIQGGPLNGKHIQPDGKPVAARFIGPSSGEPSVPREMIIMSYGNDD